MHRPGLLLRGLLLAYLGWAGIRQLTDAEYAGLFEGVNFGVHELGHLVFAVFGGVIGLGVFMFTQLSSELTPPEDRGVLLVSVNGPEGAGFDYTSRVMREVESVLLEYVESGEAPRVLILAPGFGDIGTNRSAEPASPPVPRVRARLRGPRLRSTDPIVQAIRRICRP